MNSTSICGKLYNYFNIITDEDILKIYITDTCRTLLMHLWILLKNG